MAEGTWTEQRVATLRRMQAAGCTDREIALALGLTPRAVTGKRQRLGLVTHGLSSQDAYEASMARAERRKRKRP